jgi:hypothetical protein
MGCAQESNRVEATAAQREGGVNHPMVQSVEITPQQAFVTDTLMAIAREQTPGQTAPSLHYQWFQNGIEIPGMGSQTLTSTTLKKGDLITVRVTPTEGGRAEGSLVSEPARVLNSPPRVISVSLIPNVVHSRDQLEASVEGTDEDHDSPTYFYQWYINNQEIEGETTSILDHRHFAKGDQLYVVVTPFDGEERGLPKKSEPIAVLNSLPTISSTPPFSIDKDGVYQYQIKAEDSDDDPLLFEIEKGPQGMTVDTRSGLLSWRPGEGNVGTHTVQIAAIDPNGAKGIQQYDLQIFIKEAAAQ